MPSPVADGFVRTCAWACERMIPHPPRTKRAMRPRGPKRRFIYSSFRWGSREKKVGESLEHRPPAGSPLVRTLATIEEGRLVGELEQRAVAIGCEFHRAERHRDAHFVLVHGACTDDAFVRHDVEEAAFLSQVRRPFRAEAGALMTADAKVLVELGQLPVVGAREVPAGALCRIGPGGVHLFRRYREASLDDDRVVDDSVEGHRSYP